MRADTISAEGKGRLGVGVGGSIIPTLRFITVIMF